MSSKPSAPGLFATLAILATTLLPACSIHRLDIPQGVVLKEEALNKIATGMTKKQVQFLLGPPPIEDPFHAGRWDYVDLLVTKNGIERHHHIVLYFKDGRLARIERRIP